MPPWYDLPVLGLRIGGRGADVAERRARIPLHRREIPERDNADRLPPYSSYFTSQRYVVYSPTKKGWRVG
jgi:hypothetical protein